MSKKRTQRRSTQVSKKQLEQRNTLWPKLNEDLLWDNDFNDGWSFVPRTMPLIIKIMNEISNQKPLGSTYLDLWLKSWEHSFVVIANQDERAFYSGFSGQRAVSTWRDRMRRLSNFGFINVQKGASGPFNYVLIWNPHYVLQQLKAASTPGMMEESYNAFMVRLSEIGDKIPILKNVKE